MVTWWATYNNSKKYYVSNNGALGHWYCGDWVYVRDFVYCAVLGM